MHPLQLRERVSRPVTREQQPPKVAASPLRAMRMETVTPRTMPAGKTVSVRSKQPIPQDQRVQHEMAEMKETADLRQIDDDVEDMATMYEWQAHEHVHRPKNHAWFATLAAVTAVAVGVLGILGNFMGAVTVGLVGALTYYIAQQRPAVVRYRIMVDGVAVNNLLYHYKDLSAFNIIYEPGQTKILILRSKRRFSPHLHIEIDAADPVAMRNVLLEFLPEDQDMEEPLVDVLARRLGF